MFPLLTKNKFKVNEYCLGIPERFTHPISTRRLCRLASYYKDVYLKLK